MFRSAKFLVSARENKKKHVTLIPSNRLLFKYLREKQMSHYDRASKKTEASFMGNRLK